ncbi:MAG: iron-containing alcohol dehydrogenase [Clostridiales bacterium]|jgi:alcohol dehydrogenase YqhD (iron-dependent ADH family)|nr:iron-containing alcohol dehydrogenase [Clostridiales bacterium]
MYDFEYYAPTKVFFGRDSDEKIGTVLRDYGASRILLHYGRGSAEKSGLLDKVRKSLSEAGLEYIEFGNVEANPKIDLIRRGIELSKKENIDFILAVGGGSVIDSAKSISLGLAHDMDPWEMITSQIMPTKNFPIGVVLTHAAAGSEMSNSHVVTNPEYNLKRSLNHDLLRPIFAFMNPENTYSVSKYQTGCGIVDILMHTCERYFTIDEDNDLTDRISEGLMVAVKNAGIEAIKDPYNYEARATLMWASSLSHNGLTGCGKKILFPVHKMEHDFSGLFDHVAHAAGLSVLFPAWAKYVYKHDIRKFSQFATRVWGVEMNYDNPERTALRGIEVMTEYFRQIGMPTTMKELGINPEDYESIVNLTTDNGKKTIASYVELTKEDILNIYRLAE